MLRAGHYGAALALYAPAGFLFLSIDAALAALGGVCAVGLSRLPDYDRVIPFVKHRGVTHTPWFLVMVAAITGGSGHVVAGTLGTPPSTAAAVGGVAGSVAIGSHLLADTLTPAGVPLLWPFSPRRVSVDVTTASNPVANVGLLAFGVVVTAAVVYAHTGVGW